LPAKAFNLQTPLNNNIRELFNLMNFLEPEEWRDLEKLEEDHKELTEELIKELHHKLRPYFLRRTKAEVLQLPPKVRYNSSISDHRFTWLHQNEVIVPVSMTPLQKEIYRLILSMFGLPSVIFSV
jgi:chromodomain-helicase-DNA-binding protein 4